MPTWVMTVLVVGAYLAYFGGLSLYLLSLGVQPSLTLVVIATFVGSTVVGLSLCALPPPQRLRRHR